MRATFIRKTFVRGRDLNTWECRHCGTRMNLDFTRKKHICKNCRNNMELEK